ncbi:hypothetical protein HY620_00100 [Candidatus Uhrbacteria bacterium]|nr:hypothetical protein [Candidatus Uhrbacteria bacterium]
MQPVIFAQAMQLSSLIRECREMSSRIRPREGGDRSRGQAFMMRDPADRASLAMT